MLSEAICTLRIGLVVGKLLDAKEQLGEDAA